MKNFEGSAYRHKMFGIVAIAIYFVSGLLLLLFPDLMTDIAAYVISVGLCVAGIVGIVGYIRADLLVGVKGFGLAGGLMGLFVGVVLLFNPGLLKASLPFLWGVFLLVGGFGKVQFAFDCLRMKDCKWWTLLVGALISFVLGVFAIVRPTFLLNIVAQFVGISMLVEAALDVAALIAVRRKLKAYESIFVDEK